MIVRKVGRRGQLTIPRAIQKNLNINQGDRIAFIRRENEVVLQPLTQSFLELRGSLPVTETQEFEYVRQAVIQKKGQQIAQDG